MTSFFFRNSYYDGVVVFLVFFLAFCRGFFIAMLWVGGLFILTPLVVVLCCAVLWRVYRISSCLVLAEVEWRRFRMRC